MNGFVCISIFSIMLVYYALCVMFVHNDVKCLQLRWGCGKLTRVMAMKFRLSRIFVFISMSIALAFLSFSFSYFLLSCLPRRPTHPTLGADATPRATSRPRTHRV